MSRTTVREALRILDVQGLIRIKAGRTGGAFVQQPGDGAMASTVDLLIRGRQVRLAVLLKTREAIEPFCAQLAAVNRTKAELEILEESNRLISGDDAELSRLSQASVDWDVGVARASHNELLSGLMAALSRAIYSATEDEKFVDAEVRQATIHAHATITDAIRDRDADAADRRMRRHVHSHAEEVLRRDRQEAESS